MRRVGLAHGALVSRVGLVLGAGGVVGQAYHAGVLAALERECGFDASAAHIIVGTSAGSISGALLRLGVPAADLAGWTVAAPLTDDVTSSHVTTIRPPELAPFRAMNLLRGIPRPPTMPMVRRAAVHPLHFRPIAAGLALLAPGRYDILEQLSALRALENAVWPDRDLWICAVRRRDGRRVVFGRTGAPPASIHLAIGASCAVPGYFAPVRIGDHTYVDGGAHSPTNAAVLHDLDLDLVIVVSPMSGPTGSRPDVYAATRRHAARLLAREIKALNVGGTRTVVFSPGAAEQRVMGNDLMSRRRTPQVIEHAFAAATATARGTEIRELLRDAVRSTPAGTGGKRGTPKAS